MRGRSGVQGAQGQELGSERAEIIKILQKGTKIFEHSAPIRPSFSLLSPALALAKPFGVENSLWMNRGLPSAAPPQPKERPRMDANYQKQKCEIVRLKRLA
jgi:hypothetical protein